MREWQSQAWWGYSKQTPLLLPAYRLQSVAGPLSRTCLSTGKWGVKEA
jgi:hypothetical protein